MKIFVDGRTIKQNPSGVGIWNLRLTKELLEKDIDTIYLLTQKNCDYPFATDPNFKNFIPSKLYIIEAPHGYKFVSLNRFLFEQLLLARIIQRLNPDIAHFTDSFGIPFLLGKIKTVLTVHDLIPLTAYKENLNQFQFLLYKLSLKISLTKARRIVAISDKTKEDIVTLLNLAGEKISVIYDGVDEPVDFNKKELDNIWKRLSKDYGLLNKRYIFYLGGFGKRRNIPTLITVFHKAVIQKIIPSSYKLVLCGRMSQAKKEALENIEKTKHIVKKLQLERNVIFMDYVTNLEKTVLTNHSLFFLSLSFYEGFGLGPIEALKENKAAIFTRVGIWKSHKANSFIIENPLSHVEILDKIQQLLHWNLKQSSDFEDLRHFVKQFSWKKMANEYFNLYTSLLK